MRIEPLEPTSCEEYLELADLVAANGLRDEERELLDSHLAVCDQCHEAVDLDQLVRASVRRTALVAPPALAAHIRAALDKLDTTAARVDWRPRRWIAAAAAMLVFTLGGWAYAAHWNYSWSPAQDMIHKHAVYLEQSKPGWSIATPDRSELARWGSDQLGYRVFLPAYTDDWTVGGVRTEPINGTPTLMAFFTDPTGMPASLFAFSAKAIPHDELIRHLEPEQHGKWWSGRLKLQQVHGERQFHVELWREGDLYFGVVRVSPELANAR